MSAEENPLGPKRPDFALLLSLAAAAALVGSIPCALRAARAGSSFLLAVPSSFAILLPFAFVVLAVARGASRGFAMLNGNRPSRATATWIALWIGLATPILLTLGYVLKVGTNHRGLGGATFGALALFSALGAAAVANRVLAMVEARVGAGTPPMRAGIFVASLTVLPTLALALVLTRGQTHEAGTQRTLATLIDVAIFCATVALALSNAIPERFIVPARRWGSKVAIALFAAGCLALMFSKSVARAMSDGGGLSPTVMRVLERWTDRDGDGAGAFFGGGDCDEGDPRRHRGAEDVPDDGIDQDCDGKDATRHGAGPGGLAFGGLPGLGTGTAAASAAPPPVPPPSTKPSLLLITLDTVRADRTSLYGYGKPTTRELEKLAERAIVFDHAFAAAPDTQHALVPVVSGERLERTPHNKRTWPTIADSTETVAERLKDQGYTTFAVTSFNWLSRDRGFAQGFDTFENAADDVHPEREVTGKIVTKKVKAILEKLESGSGPVFGWVHLFDAHAEYLEHRDFAFGRSKSDLYDGEIASVDRELGEIMRAVTASKRMGEVRFVIHGSHGEAFGEHDNRGHGRDLYQEVIAVPFVIGGPGVAAGRRADPVSTLDIAPTLLALAGAKADSTEGVSLAGLLVGAPLPPRSLFVTGPKRAAIIDFPHKLVVIDRDERDRTLLFDLSADPREGTDLSSKEAAQVERLKPQLTEFRAALRRDERRPERASRAEASR